MPDVHWGLGATIGSVVPTKGAIIPAAVGVDIGRGMLAVQTTLNANQLPDNLRNIRRAIEKAVPHGRTDHGGKRDKGAWGEIPRRQVGVWRQLEIGYKAVIEKYPKLDRGNHVNHLGTLGGGNHFIELCLDENDQVWFMLHSGSRGVGNRIGTFFIEMAKSDMRAHIKNLPDKDLAYFNEGTEHFDDYVEAVSWAQEFAMYNRKLMMEQIVDAVADSGEVPEFELTKTAINCHHNYCIPASEIIPTPAGPKTITELKPGDNVYSFEPQQGLVETRVVRWVASGKKRIFTIRTKHRRVRVSDDHPLLMIQVKMGAHPDRAWHLKGSGSYIWKRARDLRVGDILVCAHGYYSSTNLPVGNGLARFIGAFLGDGWIRQQTASGYTVGLAIGNREAVVTQKYAKLLADELFPEAHWFNNVPGAFGLTCSSKAVHSAVIDMELGYPSADKYLPNHCFSLPLEEKNLFWLAILMLMAALRTAGDDFPPAATD
jgi:tRNA-splicing ligase RtcB